MNNWTNLSLYLLWIMVTAYGCKTSIPFDEISQENPNNSSLIVDKDQLFKVLGPYSMRSEITLTLKNATSEKTSSEQVEIEGSKNLIHLVKRLDSHHFIEIIKNNRSFLTRTRNGPWHEAQDKMMIENILYEGMNTVEWFFDKFGLKKNLKPSAVYEFHISDMPKNPPFLQELALMDERLKDMEFLKAYGSIKFTKNTLTTASFHVDLKSRATPQNQVILAINVNVSPSKTLPINIEKSDFEPKPKALVNIRSRFHEILNAL